MERHPGPKKSVLAANRAINLLSEQCGGLAWLVQFVGVHGGRLVDIMLQKATPLILLQLNSQHVGFFTTDN
jgi:hypothetical protein